MRRREKKRKNTQWESRDIERNQDRKKMLPLTNALWVAPDIPHPSKQTFDINNVIADQRAILLHCVKFQRVEHKSCWARHIESVSVVKASVWWSEDGVRVKCQGRTACVKQKDMSQGAFSWDSYMACCTCGFPWDSYMTCWTCAFSWDSYMTGWTCGFSRHGYMTCGISWDSYMTGWTCGFSWDSARQADMCILLGQLHDRLKMWILLGQLHDMLNMCILLGQLHDRLNMCILLGQLHNMLNM